MEKELVIVPLWSFCPTKPHHHPWVPTVFTFHSLRMIYSPKCLLLIMPKFLCRAIDDSRDTQSSSLTNRSCKMDLLAEGIPGPGAAKPSALDTMREGGSNGKFRKPRKAPEWKSAWDSFSVRRDEGLPLGYPATRAAKKGFQAGHRGLSTASRGHVRTQSGLAQRSDLSAEELQAQERRPVVAGGLLCFRYFLNSGAGLPARCPGAALASRRTSSFAAKPGTWLSSSFLRLLCQAQQSERQDLWGGLSLQEKELTQGSSWCLAFRTTTFRRIGLKCMYLHTHTHKLARI